MNGVDAIDAQIKKREKPRPPRYRGILPLIALSLFALAQLPACNAGENRKTTDIAPDFKVVVFNGNKEWLGREITLSSLRGEPVIIHFSSSWCAACKYIFKSLEPFREKGLFVMGIGVLDKETKFRRMIDVMDITTPVAYDMDGIAKKYKVSTLPLTVFITKEGKIFKRVHGTLGKERLEGIVEGLFKA